MLNCKSCNRELPAYKRNDFKGYCRNCITLRSYDKVLGINKSNWTIFYINGEKFVSSFCEQCGRERKQKKRTAIKICNLCQKKEEWHRNKKCYLEKAKEKYKETKSKKNNYYKLYYKLNKQKFIGRNRKNTSIRYKNDINYKIKKTIGHRLRLALKGQKKNERTEKLLGCSIGQLKLYLENYFPLYPGMSWNNYGIEWHIDHYIPISKFNLSDSNELTEACHYTNLQPLWAQDNYAKGNRI